jgi:two-component system phosphate regulon sensor histidine kinase PhoR
MSAGTRKTYRFAAYSSVYITFFLTSVTAILFWVSHFINYWYLLAFAGICYITSFLIIQNRVEKFIYKRIKKMYDDVSLLEEFDFSRGHITTDLKTLTEDVERFARDKKLEIETLKIRENYRKEFIGNVSHELKTPLFTVQSYLLTLLDGAMKDKTVRKKYLKNANKAVERLIYIVKDLDMISQFETGGLQLVKEDFNVIKLVQNVFEFLEIKAAKKNISLTFDIDYLDPVMVHADKERIQQVLSNLIENSIKYGKAFGTTEVSVEYIIKRKVIIRITDNGEGIEKEHIPRIFERFYRVDKSGSRKVGGSGLGLSIVKHIVEAHKEKIYVESQIGVGSEFSFTLEKSK